MDRSGRGGRSSRGGLGQPSPERRVPTDSDGSDLPPRSQGLPAGLPRNLSVNAGDSYSASESERDTPHTSPEATSPRLTPSHKDRQSAIQKSKADFEVLLRQKDEEHRQAIERLTQYRDKEKEKQLEELRDARKSAIAALKETHQRQLQQQKDSLEGDKETAVALVKDELALEKERTNENARFFAREVKSISDKARRKLDEKSSQFQQKEKKFAEDMQTLREKLQLTEQERRDARRWDAEVNRLKDEEARTRMLADDAAINHSSEMNVHKESMQCLLEDRDKLKAEMLKQKESHIEAILQERQNAIDSQQKAVTRVKKEKQEEYFRKEKQWREEEDRRFEEYLDRHNMAQVVAENKALKAEVAINKFEKLHPRPPRPRSWFGSPGKHLILHFKSGQESIVHVHASCCNWQPQRLHFTQNDGVDEHVHQITGCFAGETVYYYFTVDREIRLHPVQQNVDIFEEDIDGVTARVNRHRIPA